MPAVQFKDYYKTLELGRGATQDEIKSAYKRLARKYHPDLNQGDKSAEERFKEINEAQEVLTDPEKRKLYDRYGDAWRQYKEAGFTGDEPVGRPRERVSDADFGEWFTRQGGRTASTNGTGTSWTYRSNVGGERGDGRGFSDFFQTLFGNLGGISGFAHRDGTRGPTAQRGRSRGEDLEVDVEVSFDEAFKGATRTFEVQSADTCPTCRGAGLVRESLCPTCDGTGQVAKSKALEVKIPAGVNTGSKVRVKGQGGPGIAGGGPGDVVLRIKVAPDKRFERDGDDLRVDVDVPLYTALLGGEVIVPTPDGRVALNVPPESQNGRVFRLRKKGMPRLRAKAATGPNGDDRGDLLARLKVVLPTELSESERGLVTRLRDLRNPSGTASGS
jgi:molecular chaperone DnaJ